MWLMLTNAGSLYLGSMVVLVCAAFLSKLFYFLKLCSNQVYNAGTRMLRLKNLYIECKQIMLLFNFNVSMRALHAPTV